MTSVDLVVVGLPAPQGSKTVVPTRAGPRTKESSKFVKPWRDAVSSAACIWIEEHEFPPPLDGPIEITVEFRLPRPKGHYGTGRHAGQLKAGFMCPFHFGYPDASKLLRSTEDALVASGIVVDDSRFAVINTRKMYAVPPRHPIGATISLRELL
jgi:Holliday junction resolvase RusA-like endonuclease